MACKLSQSEVATNVSSANNYNLNCYKMVSINEKNTYLDLLVPETGSITSKFSFMALKTSDASWKKYQRYHAISCNIMQQHVISCNIM